MNRKWFFNFAALVVVLSMLLSACGGASGGEGGMKTEIGEGEGEVEPVNQ